MVSALGAIVRRLETKPSKELVALLVRFDGQQGVLEGWPNKFGIMHARHGAINLSHLDQGIVVLEPQGCAYRLTEVRWFVDPDGVRHGPF